MASTTIRIRQKTHKALKNIATATGKSLQDALDRAIEQEERRLYLEGVNADYEALYRDDPKGFAEMQKEAAEWDVTLQDGLEDL